MPNERDLIAAAAKKKFKTSGLEPSPDDDILTRQYKELAGTGDDVVAFDRHYRYPIFPLPGVENDNASNVNAFYMEPNTTQSRAERIGPGVVINTKNQPMSVPLNSGIDPIEWIKDRGNAPAVLSHERVHHMQGIDHGQNMYDTVEGMRRGSLPDLAFRKMAERLYGDRTSEAHAFALSNTLEPTTDADLMASPKLGNFLQKPTPLSPFDGGPMRPKVRNILDPTVQAELQQYLYDRLDPAGKKAMHSSLNRPPARVLEELPSLGYTLEEKTELAPLPKKRKK